MATMSRFVLVICVACSTWVAACTQPMACSGGVRRPLADYDAEAEELESKPVKRRRPLDDYDIQEDGDASSCTETCTGDESEDESSASESGDESSACDSDDESRAGPVCCSFEMRTINAMLAGEGRVDRMPMSTKLMNDANIDSFPAELQTFEPLSKTSFNLDYRPGPNCIRNRRILELRGEKGSRIPSTKLMASIRNAYGTLSRSKDIRKTTLL